MKAERLTGSRTKLVKNSEKGGTFKMIFALLYAKRQEKGKKTNKQ